MDNITISTKLVRVLFDWRGILDIVLIAAGLFLLYRTLRRLGTWKIVAGILLAMTVFVAANLLELRGVGWIYSNLSQVAVIALIVIFQPELRKVFERAASPRRHEVGRGADLSTVISDAVFSLAEQLRGAIIVFPGKEPVREWLSGGLPLDAEPSFSLVMSIFDPHSPGHDGALVIENGKLGHFGVRLPLSKREGLAEEFGTRHHAAMGLSEVCDVLVLVVSEERGAVTSFHGGKLEVEQDRKEVAAKIAAHWQDTASYTAELYKEKKPWGLFTEIGVSVALALALWLTVVISQAEIREKGFTVPIEYMGIPKHLILADKKPTEVKLQLSGPKWELDELNPSQLRVKVNLSTAMAGQQLFNLSNENVDLPTGVKLVDAEPSHLTLLVLEITEKEVMIQPQLVGTLPNGLELVAVELEPDDIRVLSAAGDQNQIISLVTTPIYLGNIKENTKLLAKIISPPNIRPATGVWPDVAVEITVQARE